jgi:hypothetical protein
VGLEVVGVAVAAGLVVGDQHLGPLLANDLDQAIGRLRQVRGTKGARPMVLWPAGHARVEVAKIDQPAHSQASRGGFELAVAQRADAGRAHQAGLADLAQVATSAGDDNGPHAFGAVARERAAHADRLVVGVGVNR